MKKRGFTLIELAIVLTVIGLMVGGSFKMLKMMRERAKTQEAKEQVLAAKNAVFGYVLEWPNLPSGSEFSAELSPSQDQNHPMFYAADTTLSTINNDVCAFNTTSLSVVDNSYSPARTISNVAFVLAHEGANYNMQTALNSNVVNIYSPSTVADDNLTNMNNMTHEYDDVVEWVTISQLHEEIGCINREFRFLNDKLPNAKELVDYNATLYVENNVSNVSINCTPSPQKGISFSDPNFSGTPNNVGVALFNCTATEDVPSSRSIVKEYAISIDPYLNKPLGVSCALDSECASGICVSALCSSGVIGNICIDGGDCKSGICVGGLCSGGFVGDSCIGDADCVSGPCVSGSCTDGGAGSTGGSSSSGLPSGSLCNSHSDCASGLQCTGPNPKTCK